MYKMRLIKAAQQCFTISDNCHEDQLLRDSAGSYPGGVS